MSFNGWTAPSRRASIPWDAAHQHTRAGQPAMRRLGRISFSERGISVQRIHTARLRLFDIPSWISGLRMKMQGAWVWLEVNSLRGPCGDRMVLCSLRTRINTCDKTAENHTHLPPQHTHACKSNKTQMSSVDWKCLWPSLTLSNEAFWREHHWFSQQAQKWLRRVGRGDRPWGFMVAGMGSLLMDRGLSTRGGVVRLPQPSV